MIALPYSPYPDWLSAKEKFLFVISDLTEIYWRMQTPNCIQLWVCLDFSLPLAGLWAIVMLWQKCFPPPQLCPPLPLIHCSPPLFPGGLWNLCLLSLHPNSWCWQLSGPTRSFPCDVFNWAALIPTDDSEEVTAELEWSACRRDRKPVCPSSCLFTHVSLSPYLKPLHLVRTITPRPLVSPSLPQLLFQPLELWWAKRDASATAWPQHCY